ncbi:MAG TPA: DUF2155 domain-containing protein [Geobacteraceae bacterium]
MTLASAALLAGCSGKEENKPAEKAPDAKQVIKKETVVSVPPAVKKKWKAVKIGVTDKEKNREAVIPIDIGTSFEVPDTGLTIKVENFLPQFVMEGATITSQSTEAKNPAAQVRVTENGKEIFKGWLFTLYPNTHAFQHPRYSFALVDYIPNK